MPGPFLGLGHDFFLPHPFSALFCNNPIICKKFEALTAINDSRDSSLGMHTGWTANRNKIYLSTLRRPDRRWDRESSIQ
jgi:hypothetical protein